MLIGDSQASANPNLAGERLTLPPLGDLDPRSRYAVIFLLDRKYLTPLRVLLNSMQNAVRERTCDIVVLTNDVEVTRDPFIKAQADRVICLADEDIATIATMRRDAVKSMYHHATLGKYTFLKLLAYDDLGYRGHLFLDCDMICLDPDFRFEDLFFEDYDFAAARPVGHENLGIRNTGPAQRTSCTPKEQKRIEKIFRARLVSEARKLGGFNSGVFFAGRRLLRRETVEHILDLGRREAFSLEQEMTGRALSEIQGLRNRTLGFGYNATVLTFYAMGEQRFERVRDNITFLHYNRKRKPWQFPRSEADWLERIWWQALDDANSPDGAFSLHTERQRRQADANSSDTVPFIKVKRQRQLLAQWLRKRWRELETIAPAPLLRLLRLRHRLLRRLKGR